MPTPKFSPGKMFLLRSSGQTRPRRDNIMFERASVCPKKTIVFYGVEYGGPGARLVFGLVFEMRHKKQKESGGRKLVVRSYRMKKKGGE